MSTRFVSLSCRSLPLGDDPVSRHIRGVLKLHLRLWEDAPANRIPAKRPRRWSKAPRTACAATSVQTDPRRSTRRMSKPATAPEAFSRPSAGLLQPDLYRASMTTGRVADRDPLPPGCYRRVVHPPKPSSRSGLARSGMAADCVPTAANRIADGVDASSRRHRNVPRWTAGAGRMASRPPDHHRGPAGSTGTPHARPSKEHLSWLGRFGTEDFPAPLLGRSHMTDASRFPELVQMVLDALRRDPDAGGQGGARQCRIAS